MPMYCWMGHYGKIVTFWWTAATQLRGRVDAQRRRRDGRLRRGRALAKEIEEGKDRHQGDERQESPADPDIRAAATQIPVSPKIDRVGRLSHAEGFGGAIPLSSGIPGSRPTGQLSHPRDQIEDLSCGSPPPG